MLPSLFEPRLTAAPKQLRPHQARALESVRASLDAGKMRPLIQAPTGFGKTLLASKVIEPYLVAGERALFVAPSVSLIGQTIAAFEAEGISDIGAMQADHPRTNSRARVQIATVQTLARRSKPDAAIVLVDEAHEVHQSLVKLMRGPRWASVPFVGLSATPWTRGLGKIYDDLIIASTTRDLIESGYLSPFRVFTPSKFDLSAVRVRAGEYVEGDLSKAVDTPKLVGDVVETWLRLGESRPTLVYGVDRAHAKHLQERFREVGVSAEYVDYNTDRLKREIIFDRFRSGECKVICNISTLTTGIDLDVRCIVDAHPTQSEMRYVQTIGRGLRTAAGKDDLIVLDHAGNALRLGLVTDIHHDKLDDGKRTPGAQQREKAERLPKLCEECKAVIPSHALTCPQCGTPIRSKSAVVAKEGQLVQFGKDDRPQQHTAPSDAEKRVFYGELKGLFSELNRQRAAVRKPPLRPGWPDVQFREKFGQWPDHVVRQAFAVAPSLKTRQWVKSRQITFAKARAAHG